VELRDIAEMQLLDMTEAAGMMPAHSAVQLSRAGSVQSPHMILPTVAVNANAHLSSNSSTISGEREGPGKNCHFGDTVAFTSSKRSDCTPGRESCNDPIYRNMTMMSAKASPTKTLPERTIFMDPGKSFTPGGNKGIVCYKSEWTDGERIIVQRLQTRLDIRYAHAAVTAIRLHKTLARLGSSRYTADELSAMLMAIAPHVLDQSDSRKGPPDGSKGLPFVDFADFIMHLDDYQNRGISVETMGMIAACKEILIAGDANRLVAELTQVHVDELCQPIKYDILSKWLEPIVGVFILLNGITIGLEAERASENHRLGTSWFWLDVAFTTFFASELAMKFVVRGGHWFLWSPERWWNVFDTALVLLGLVDLLLVVLIDGEAYGTRIFSILRIIRVGRLTRLFSVLRLKHMKELTLMVKGVFAGMRTLLWAILLLLFTIYVIGVFATTVLHDEGPEQVDDMFASVPKSMFTIFRCLMSDCDDERGRPLAYLYYVRHGVLFAISYVASMVFVVFGIFNLIFAIYIETTMAAAKRQRKMNHAEMVYMARSTRELLKKFSLAQSIFAHQDPLDMDAYTDTDEFRQIMKKGLSAAEADASTFSITKEVFTLVLKDPEVQKLLDALDISPDRMHLFDILDADGSGAIQAAELIQGLLQVRGEAKKSDVVANLLAVRAAQNMIRELSEETKDLRAEIGALQVQVEARSVARGECGPSHGTFNGSHGSASWLGGSRYPNGGGGGTVSTVVL